MALISTKKADEIIEKSHVNSAKSIIHKYAPIQFSFWQDTFLATSNELARSSIFTCRDTRAPREHLVNHQVFVLGEGAITYTGEELREFDEQIFLTLAKYARDLRPDALTLQITSSQLCKANGWLQDQRYYTNIYRSIVRMKATTLHIMSRRLAIAMRCQHALDEGASNATMKALYDELDSFERSKEFNQPLTSKGKEIAGLLISLIGDGTRYTGAKSIKDGIPQGNLTWSVVLNADMIKLFAKPWLTLIDFEVRKKLSPTARRLQEYYLSHREPYPVKLRSLEQLLGLNIASLASLKTKITGHLESLKSNSVIKDFELTWTTDRTDWLVTVVREQPSKEHI